MAKKAGSSASKALVIVESPAKARTISKFLGRSYEVEASIGHVRDLPEGAKQVPAKYKGEPWANLGVNVEQNFEPIYVVPAGKTKQIKKLKDRLKDAQELYLATDEDREGEAISWHLVELLKPKVPVRRLVFHEITKSAIEEALANPRDIDEDLVRAQEARRILDRLYGYEVSPLLWRKVRPKLSAGRVQSVAVRLIVDRERERMAFHSATWWDLLATFATREGAKFDAGLVSVDGRRIPLGKDFDSKTGQLKQEGLALLDQDAAGELAERIRRGAFRSPASRRNPTAPRRPRPLRRARCSRRPIASSVTRPAARCRSPKVSMKTGTLLTCVPTRQTWRPSRSTTPASWFHPSTVRNSCPATPAATSRRSRTRKRRTKRFARRDIRLPCPQSSGTS
jgi:DNA topoisomerase-1